MLIALRKSFPYYMLSFQTNNLFIVGLSSL